MSSFFLFPPYNEENSNKIILVFLARVYFDPTVIVTLFFLRTIAKRKKERNCGFMKWVSPKYTYWCFYRLTFFFLYSHSNKSRRNIYLQNCINKFISNFTFSYYSKLKEKISKFISSCNYNRYFYTIIFSYV